MVVEQPGIADITGQHVHPFMPADLLDFPDVGTGAGGRPHEAAV